MGQIQEKYCAYGVCLIGLAVGISSATAQETQGGQASQDQTPAEIEEVVIYGRQSPYYRLSETATKTDRDLLETPLSVTILNKNFLEDLRTETVSDAYAYTLGLSQSGVLANGFTLRGLPSDLQNIQVDGLPGLASRFGSPTTANIERIEVLKGPASVLYGLMEPGGLVNITTKRPSADRLTILSGTAQSYAGETSDFGDDLGGTITIDSTGPIGGNERFLYRLVASYENINSFRDGVTYKNIFIFPSLSYQFTDNILATVGLEYVKEEGDADDGLVAVNDDIDLTAPLDVRYQEDGDFDNDKGIVGFFRLDYDIGANTLFRVNARSVFHEDERRLFENNRVNDAADPFQSTLRRRDRHQLNKRQYHFLDTNLAHKFDTGPLRHSVLAGFNGGFERSDFERIRFGSSITPNISVFEPEFGVGVPVAETAGTDRITDRWNYGFYAQDVVDIGRYVTLMFGARYDRQIVDFKEQVSGFTDDQTTEAFLPQGGIVIKPTDFLSIYASYTESFSPNSVERRAADGSSFDPEEGNQIEIGAKATFLDERINATFAVFDIEKTNILERNTNGDWELLGELESKGFEFELQALPIQNWQFRMGYAYVDSIVSDSDTVELIGARNSFAPEHDFFIWSRYNFPNPVLGGVVGASLGVNFESTRFTDENRAAVATPVELPSYARADMGLYYETETFGLALNVENLFDQRYYTGGSRDTKIYPGDPRLITLSTRFKF